MKRRFFVSFLILVVLLLSIPIGAGAIPAGEGKTVNTGDNLASFTVPAGLQYNNKMDTLALISEIGDVPTYLEIGSVEPVDENQTWIVYFEYEEVGYIKDNEKSNIDADKILNEYTQGTEDANITKSPENEIHVVGWDVKPSYDAATHTLQWSMILEDNAGDPTVNYRVETLTRKGYVSFTLAADPAEFEMSKQVLLEKIIPNFKVKEGNRYEDFNASTDRVANFGLSGLILDELNLDETQKAELTDMVTQGMKIGLWILVGGVVFVIGIVIIVIVAIMKRSTKKDIPPGLGHGYVAPQQPPGNNQPPPPGNPMG